MDGIILTPLNQIHHPKGDIYHAMKKSDDGFDGFGEAYFSTVHKNDIKGELISLSCDYSVGEDDYDCAA